MYDAAAMRTTLDIDEDLLALVKDLAANRGSTAGKVITELARKGLQPAEEPVIRNGVRLLPKARSGAPPTTLELVNRLRDEP